MRFSLYETSGGKGRPIPRDRKQLSGTQESEPEEKGGVTANVCGVSFGVTSVFKLITVRSHIGTTELYTLNG
jgi:hypothetical protein